MSLTGVFSVSRLAPGFLDGRDYVSRAFDLYRFISLAVKSPDRCFDKTGRFGFVAASAKSNTGRKQLRMLRNDRKGAKAAHRLTRDIKTSAVDAIGALQIAKQFKHKSQLARRRDRVILDPALMHR